MIGLIRDKLYRHFLSIIILLCIWGNTSFSQTDTLNISWDLNPPADTVQYYLLYRVLGNSLSDTSQQGTLLDTVYENSGTVIGNRIHHTDLDRNLINPGALISYRVRAVNLDGISAISAHAHAGIPEIIWSTTHIDSGRTTAFPVSSFLRDLDHDPSQLSLDAAQATNVSLQIQNNQLLITPNPQNYTGSASFELTVFDPDSFWDRSLVTLTIDTGLTQNNKPLAVNDTAITYEETAVPISVLDNDFDPDGDPLIVSDITDDPAHGVAVISQSTRIIYTPQQGFVGDDNFQYEIFDGRGGRDTAFVYVTVFSGSPVNNKPIAVNDTVNTNQGEAITIEVLNNDWDPDGDNLSVSAIVNDAQQGTTVINSGSTVTYSPQSSYVGVDNFRYEVHDGHGGRDTALVRIILLTTESIDANVIAFPNPYRSSSSYDNIVFEPLPSGAREIVIVSTAGKLVYEETLDPTQSRRWEWEVKKQDIASGLYIYIIKGNGGEKIASGKIAIIR